MLYSRRATALLVVFTVFCGCCCGSSNAAEEIGKQRTFGNVECVAELRAADKNGDRTVDITEYIVMVAHLSKNYEGLCEPSLIADVAKELAKASCFCRDYLNSTIVGDGTDEDYRPPPCVCEGPQTNIALPNTIYPGAYTIRVCESLKEFMENQPRPPTAAPVTMAPTTESFRGSTTLAPSVAEDAVGVKDDSGGGSGNAAGIAVGIVIPLLVLVAGFFGGRFWMEKRRKGGTVTSSTASSNSHKDIDATAASSGLGGSLGTAINRSTLNDEGGTPSKQDRSSLQEGTDVTLTLDDSDEEIYMGNDWAKAFDPPGNGGAEEDDVILEIMDDEEDDDDEEEEDSGDDDSDEDEDGFDPNSLAALSSKASSSSSKQFDLDLIDSVEVNLSPGSPKPVRKKKKKSSTPKSAKKVRAEYKKKLQKQRKNLRAIPERNLTLI